VGDIRFPRRLLRDVGLTIAPGFIAVSEERAWLADWQGTRGVLRGGRVPAGAVCRARRLDDVAWLHAFLAELAGVGFPSPRPLPAFGGQSWTVAGGWLWELVSFIPGHEVGWAAEPSMEQIGALLACYHCAARRIQVTGERHGVIPLATVPGILLSGQLDAAGPDPEQAAVIRRLAGRLAADLDDCGHRAAERLVIHGDFTNHNVIADGIPPRPVGVIDFRRAHVEAPLADIGYGLWRSGRPHQDADCLDLTRLGRFVRGYASTTPLPATEARALPVFLYGRGLQMIAKRIQAGQSGTAVLAQVQWTAANATAIADAAVCALP
jgi:Ser/Thr protein kinase RdoA (MazF antagonist)